MNVPKYDFFVSTELTRMEYTNHEVSPISGALVESQSFKSSEKVKAPMCGSVYVTHIEPGIRVRSVAFYDTKNGLSRFVGIRFINKAVLGEIKGFAGSTDCIITLTADDIESVTAESVRILTPISEVNPHYKTLSKEYKKESGQEFFRQSLNGTVKLIGSDFEIINNASINDKLFFSIYRKYALYYQTEFIKSNCVIDLSKKQVELKTPNVDQYTKILNNYETTYDLVKLKPAITKVYAHKRPIVQMYVRGGDTVSNYIAGSYYETEVSEPVDDTRTLAEKYHFAQAMRSNELEIKMLSVTEANGVYAGNRNTWTNQNGYTCYLVKAESISSGGVGIPGMRFKIRRDSDGVILYQSNLLESTGSWDTPDSELYLRPGTDYDVCTEGTSDVVGKCTNVFMYETWTRVLTDSMYSGGALSDEIPPDDFAYQNGSYKYSSRDLIGDIFCTSKTTDKPTQYGKNDFGDYFTNQFISGAAGFGRIVPLCRNAWANASIWFAYNNDYESYDASHRYVYPIYDCINIADAISALLKEVNPDIKHEGSPEYSQFLYGDTNPLRGERFYVFITQKTNILKGWYDQAAQKGETTLRDILGMLRDYFKCYWYIDEGNRLRIEHIEFFNNGGSYSDKPGVSLDTTAIKDRFNNYSADFFQSTVEYDTGSLTNEYRFKCADDVSEYFTDVNVKVKSVYVSECSPEEITSSSFTADIDRMLATTDGISNDGFAVMCATKEFTGNYLVPVVTVDRIIDTDSETSSMYRAIIQNYYASWLYLADYYMWSMPAQDIECNKTDTLRTRKIALSMKHTVSCLTEDDIPVFGLVKTSVGEGKINSMSVNLDSRKAEIELVYEPK